MPGGERKDLGAGTWKDVGSKANGEFAEEGRGGTPSRV